MDRTSHPFLGSWRERGLLTCAEHPQHGSHLLQHGLAHFLPGWNWQGTGQVWDDWLNYSSLWPGSPSSPCSALSVHLCQSGSTCPTLSMDWQVSSPMGRGTHSTHSTKRPSKSLPHGSLEPAISLLSPSLVGVQSPGLLTRCGPLVTDRKL